MFGSTYTRDVGPGRAGGPDELVGGAPDKEPRRPRGSWLVGLLLVGVALAVVRPELSLHADQPTARPRPSVAPPTSNPLNGIAWEPRGDLVGDNQFTVEAMVRITHERSEAGRLFFAGRLPDGSRLVLAGTDVNRGMVASRVHALLVPPGGEVAAGTVTEASALTDPQQVLAWAARGRNGKVVVVAMTRPGPVSFEVSAGVAFASDGSPERRWSATSAPNGVSVVDLGRAADPIVAVRALGPGVFSLPLIVRVTRQEATRPVLRVAGVAERGYGGPDAANVSRALRAGAGAVADLDEARLEVIWSGSPNGSVRLALVLVTRADGQRFQALVGQQGEYEFPAGVRALPDGASDLLPWLLLPFSPDDPTLLLCPTGPGSLVYRRQGQQDRVLPITPEGVAALVEPGPSPPSASGAVVTLLDLDGAVVLRTTLPDAGFDDPLDLY